MSAPPPPAVAVLGVGPGLGAAVARRFARAGHPIALLNRSQDTATEVESELIAAGGRAVALRVDLADAGTVRQVLNRAATELGPISVLVVNAARYTPGTGSTLDPDELVEDFRVNVVSALVAVHCVLPAMTAAGSGTILLTGGGAAVYPSADTPALSVTKAGLRALAYSLFDELAPRGIHVTTITIEGGIGSRPSFDADRIAEVYQQVHAQSQDEWAAEREYR